MEYSADLIAINEKYMIHILCFYCLDRIRWYSLNYWSSEGCLLHISEKDICFVASWDLNCWPLSEGWPPDQLEPVDQWTNGPMDHAAPEQDHFQMRWSDKLLQIQTDAAQSSSDNITYQAKFKLMWSKYIDLTFTPQPPLCADWWHQILKMHSLTSKIVWAINELKIVFEMKNQAAFMLTASARWSGSYFKTKTKLLCIIF